MHADRDRASGRNGSTLDDALQDVLAQVEAGRSESAALKQYPELRPELDQLVETASVVRDVPIQGLPQPYRDQMRATLETLEPTGPATPWQIALVAAALLGAALVAMVALDGGLDWPGVASGDGDTRTDRGVVDGAVTVDGGSAAGSSKGDPGTRIDGVGPSTRTTGRASGPSRGFNDGTAATRVARAGAARDAIRRGRTGPIASPTLVGTGAAGSDGTGLVTPGATTPAGPAEPTGEPTRLATESPGPSGGAAPATPTESPPPSATASPSAGTRPSQVPTNTAVPETATPAPTDTRAATETSVPASATPTDPTSITGISGRVVDEAGNPIPGAHVQAESTEGFPVYFVTSGGSGDYLIEAAPGAYAVSAQADGHATEWYQEARDRADASPVTVVAGNLAAGIDFSLEPVDGTPSAGRGQTLSRTAPSRPAQAPGDSSVPERLRATLPAYLPPVPIDVALSGDALYVADPHHGVVSTFDMAGDLLETLQPPAVTDAPAGCDALLPLSVEWVQPEAALYIAWGCYPLSAEPVDVAPRAVLVEQVRDGARRTVDVIFREFSGLPDLLYEPGSPHMSDPSGTVSRVMRGGPPEPLLPPREGGPVLRAAAISDGGIAAAYPERGEVIVAYRTDRPVSDVPLGNQVPLAVAGAEAGGLHVLVQAEDGRVDSPAILSFDADLTLTSSRSWSDLDLDPAEVASWPWTLASHGTGVALVGLERAPAAAPAGVADRFVVVAELEGGPTRVFGAQAQAVFSPGWPTIPAPRPAADMDPTGAVFVVDDASGRISRIGSDGAVSRAGGLPGAYDLSLDPDGRVYVLTDTGFVARLSDAQARRADWRRPCNCPPDSRLAWTESGLVVGSPRGAALTLYDPDDGERLDARSSGPGLWPSDVTGPTPLVGDLAGRHVEPGRIGAASGAPPVWRSGLAYGPDRVDASPSGDALVALTGDGFVEVHDPADGIVSARWQPLQSDGTLMYPDDVAVGTGSRVAVVNGTGGSVHLYDAKDASQPELPVASGTASACRVDAERQASPISGVAPRAVITLTLAGDCAGTGPSTPAHVVLVVDRSASMTGAALQEARRAAARFVQLAAADNVAVGLVSFADEPRLDTDLGAPPGTLLSALDGLAAGGGTDADPGIAMAAAHLDAATSHGFTAIVLVSDGGSQSGAAAAARAQAAGHTVYGLATGAEGFEALTELIDPAQVHRATSAGAFALNQAVIRDTHTGWLRDVTVTEPHLPGALRSHRPLALRQGPWLRWHATSLVQTPTVITYTVGLTQTGRTVFGEGATLRFIDSTGNVHVSALPTAVLDVPEPTPSPTPSATATAEPTRTTPRQPGPVYLPALRVSRCTKELLHVTLVIPTGSGARLGPRHDPLAAARAFLEAYDFRRGTAGIVAFDRQSELLASGGERSELLAALSRLEGRVEEEPSGNRWDLGVRAAKTDIVMSAVDPRVAGVMVLIGAAPPDETVVVRAARVEMDALLEAGVEVWVLGAEHPPWLPDGVRRLRTDQPGGGPLSSVLVRLAGLIDPCGTPNWD